MITPTKFAKRNVSKWPQVDRLLPWLVMLIALLATWQMWRYERASALKESQTRFDFQVKNSASLIEQRLQVYKQALVGLQSFFEASESVSRPEFHAYVAKLLSAEQHKGINAIGFSKRVLEAEKSQYTASIRSQGLPGYSIFPGELREVYAPIQYIEPVNHSNQRKLGYDAYSDPVRRASMDQATDTDGASVSSRLLFTDAADGDKHAGFLLYLPVYHNDRPHLQLAERRANLSGWIFLRLDADELIRHTFRNSATNIVLEIYDGQRASEQTRLYSSHAGTLGSVRASAVFEASQALHILDHEWLLVAYALPAFEQVVDYRDANVVAVIGVLASLMLMALVQLLVNRSRDVASIHRMHEELNVSEQRWKFALEGSGDGVWDWYIQTDDMHYSQRWKEILGYGVQELENNFSGWKNLIHPDDVHAVMSDMTAYLQGKTKSYAHEHRLLCKDGSWRWVLDRGMVVSRTPNRQALRMVGTLTDISRLKESEEVIWAQANFDTLTGLPNRRMFYDRLDQSIKKAHRAGLTLALIFLDLDRFKEVNDTLGHYQGDILLKEAANRLTRCVRESDTVARLGGDEFIIIVSEMDDAGVVERIAQEALLALSEPFKLENDIAYVAASLGVTFYPSDASNLDDLMKNVDQAMYAAKNLGGNRYSYFTPSMQAMARGRVQIANDLRLAIVNQQFSLAYQPIIDLQTSAITKAEALVRWHHPLRGNISPADFIPVAEDTGLIIEIGDWVFHEAVNQLHAWRSTISPQFQMSINKSPVQFYNESKSYNAWFEYIKQLDLPGDSVVVEITEGLLLDASQHVSNRLLEFRDAGIQVSLDDFGTGYSSLSYLKKFDIDYLKIDKSFVANLAAGSDDLALCQAIIVMAHKLGIKVVAEGVETQTQRDLLVEAGCDYGQGYLFSAPVSARDFELLFKV